MNAMQDNSDLPPQINRRRRRLLLGGLLSAYTATLVPWALAQPVENDGQGAFMALSAILVGRQTLDAPLGKRLYEALSAQDPQFENRTKSVLALINTQHIDPMALQKALDAGHNDLAAIPRSIVAAWYVGVVGIGANARCIAYENALMNEIVDDKLRPPTYAYGAYGTWESKPA